MARCSSSTTSATRGVFQGKASGDGWFGFQYLRAIVFFHTLDMQRVAAGVPAVLRARAGPGHHMPNRCPFGPVFVQMPFYLVGCAIRFGRAAPAQAVGGELGSRRSRRGWRRCRRSAAVLVGWRYTYRARRAPRRTRRRARRIDRRGVGDADRLVRGDAAVLSARAGASASSRILVERWDRTPRRCARGGACSCSALRRRPGDDDARAGGAVAAPARRRGAVARRARAGAPSLARRRRGAVARRAGRVPAADAGLVLLHRLAAPSAAGRAAAPDDAVLGGRAVLDARRPLSVVAGGLRVGRRPRARRARAATRTRATAWRAPAPSSRSRSTSCRRRGW